MKKLDVVGKRFGRLLVLEDEPVVYRGKNYRKCLCDCGALTYVQPSDLGRNVNSCGCLRKETSSQRPVLNLKHGLSHTREHGIWRAMHQRCYDPTSRSYKYYGARGITVCERWHIFENFFADMGERPSTEHSIDRINNDLGYSLANCRWATRIEQRKNRREK